MIAIEDEEFDGFGLFQGGGGTGLGLWISQEIVKKHDSRIQFFSGGRGKGTRFFFVLPMYERTLETVSYSMHEQRISPEVETTSMLSKVPARRLVSDGVCRVLIVDDSALNVKYLSRHIKQSKVHPESVTLEIDEANDGNIAVACVTSASQEGRPFDIVFMDSVMNVMNGPEAAQQMRAAGFGGLIVGVTGNVLARDVEIFLKAGADHILPKPVTTLAVKEILQKLQCEEQYLASWL